MCDFGVVSGPAIGSALVSAGLASSQVAATAGPAIGAALSSAALAAAGTAASSYGMSQVSKANAATASRANQRDLHLAQQERERQQKFQQDKQGSLNSAISQASPDATNAERQREQDLLTNTYSQPATDAQNSVTPGIATPASPVSDTGTRVVNDAYQNRLNSVGAYLKSQAASRAGMDAFTGMNLRTGLNTRNAVNDINLDNNFAAGSKNILGIEQGVNNNIASQQFLRNQNLGNNAQSLGNLLTALGSTGYVPRSTPTPSGTFTTKKAAAKAAPYAAGIASLGPSSYVPTALRLS